MSSVEKPLAFQADRNKFHGHTAAGLFCVEFHDAANQGSLDQRPPSIFRGHLDHVGRSLEKGSLILTAQVLKAWRDSTHMPVQHLPNVVTRVAVVCGTLADRPFFEGASSSTPRARELLFKLRLWKALLSAHGQPKAEEALLR